MTNGKNDDQEQMDETVENPPAAKLAEQIGDVNKTLQGFAAQHEQIAEALGKLTRSEEALRELKNTVEQVFSKRSSERERAIAVVKTAVWVSIGVVTVGFGAFLYALGWLEWRHVTSNAAASLSHAVTGAGSTALTLTNVHWPVSALGWAGAVGFLGFAACVAGIVAAVVASVSRLAGEGF